MSARPSNHETPTTNCDHTDNISKKRECVFFRSGQSTHSIKNRFKIFCIFRYIFDLRLSRCLLASVLFVTE